MLFRIAGDIVPNPVRQHTYLLQVSAGRQFVVFDLLQARPCGRLLSPQPGKPPVERLQRPHQRLDLANLAALRRLDNVEQTILRLMLFESGHRHRIDEVQAPLPNHPVTIGDQLLEVIARLQKDDRNVAQVLPQQMQDHHVLGLKAAGKADILPCGIAQNLRHQFFSRQRLVIDTSFQYAHSLTPANRRISSASRPSPSKTPSSAKPSMRASASTSNERAVTAMTPASCNARTAPAKAASGISASSTSTARSPRSCRASTTRAPSSLCSGTHTSTVRVAASAEVSIAATIIPAPTVALVTPSIRIHAPVPRLSAYESQKSGRLVSNSTSAISFI